MPKTLLQFIAEAEEKFFNDLAIASRFNPKEPIYGEENRQDIQRLKLLLRTSLTELAQSMAESVRLEKDKGGNELCDYNRAIDDLNTRIASFITGQKPEGE